MGVNCVSHEEVGVCEGVAGSVLSKHGGKAPLHPLIHMQTNSSGLQLREPFCLVFSTFLCLPFNGFYSFYWSKILLKEKSWFSMFKLHIKHRFKISSFNYTWRYFDISFNVSFRKVLVKMFNSKILLKSVLNLPLFHVSTKWLLVKETVLLEKEENVQLVWISWIIIQRNTFFFPLNFRRWNFIHFILNFNFNP